MEDVMNVTRFSYVILNKIRKKVISGGFDPSIYLKVTVFYIKDILKSKQPSIIIEK